MSTIYRLFPVNSEGISSPMSNGGGGVGRWSIMVNVIKERTLAQLGPKHYFFINVIVLFWRAPVPRLPCTFLESETYYLSKKPNVH